MSSIAVDECILHIDKQTIDKRKHEKDVANFVLSCVTNGSLIGLPSNSASPTDQWLVKFQPNTLYTYQNTPLAITDGFMKIFVTSPLLDKESEVNLGALLTEIKIYKTIQSMMQNQINGHFVRYLTSVDKSETLTNVNLKKFLKEKINKEEVKQNMKDSGYGDDEIRKYLDDVIDRSYIRNIICIFVSMNKEFFTNMNDPYANDVLKLIKKRPAIQKYLPYAPDILDALTKVKYKNIQFDDKYLYENLRFGFIVTESVKTDNSINFIENLPPNYSCTLEKLIKELIYHAKKNNLANVNRLLNIILTVYFQIATACYSLFVNGVSHNDLHIGNIWVKKLPENKEIYYKLTFNTGYGDYNNYYEVNSDNFSMIYDWDRSYKKWNPNPMIKNTTFSNQSNDLIEQRDFIKSLCYFISSINSLLLENGEKIRNRLPPLFSDEIHMNLHTTSMKIIEIITKSKNEEDITKVEKSLKNLEFEKTDIENLKKEAKNNNTTLSSIFWLNVYMTKSNNRYGCFLNYELNSGKFTGYINKDVYKNTLESMPIIINIWHREFIQGNILNNVDEESKSVFRIGETISVHGEIIRNIFKVSGVGVIDREINLYKTVDFSTLIKKPFQKLTKKASSFLASIYSRAKSRLSVIKEEEEEKKEEEEEKKEEENPFESNLSLSEYYEL
jgi:hypothetical protein